MKTEIDKKRHRTSLVITIALYSILMIIAGLLIPSCQDKPPYFTVAGEVGVAFGSDFMGEGDNTELVDNPSLDDSQTQTDASQEAQDEALTTDDNSDVSLKVNDKKPTPTNNNHTTNNTTNQHTNTNMNAGQGGQGGHGNDGQAGQSGVGGNMQEGSGGLGDHGKGLDMDGWGWKSKPDAKIINKAGVAKINFRINRLGVVLYCKATSTIFSASELTAIEEEFKKAARFEKLDTDQASSNSISGTFTWEFKN
jgi:hypothetical protein